MAINLNLSRNTRVWVTTNVDPNTGVLKDALTGYSAFSTANLQEIQVLDGYSFGQGTNAATITISEAGNTPARGQRSFNTALNPADIAFSTYVRPSASAGNSGIISATERILWNALFSGPVYGASATAVQLLDTVGFVGVAASTITRTSTSAAAFTGLQITASANTPTAPAVNDVLNLTGVATDPTWNGPFTVTAVTGTGPYTVSGTFAKAPAVSATTSGAVTATTKAFRGAYAENGTSFAYVSTAPSNRNQLQKFAMIFSVDNAIYVVDNCALDTATIDFGLDAISTIAWKGFGTAVKQVSTLTLAALTAVSTFSAAQVGANYITNKLSTVSLAAAIGDTGQQYIVPVTGGSITIANNIKYVTPSNLGVVNVPIGYYTGTRSITGSINAYLRTGNAGETNTTGSLLTTLLAAPSETKYKLQVEVGGLTNNNRVELDMEGVTLQVPTVNIADLVSTTINFTAQSTDPVVANTNYDITNTNDLLIRYYSSATV